MNAGILTPPTQYATMPRGLLGRPTPVPMIDYRTPLDPRTIPGLAVWLDAADRESVTLNGQNVAEWRDKSGSAKHFAQSTAANQPTHVPAALNALPGIRSNGSRHLRREDGVGGVLREDVSYLGPQSHTVFIVARADAINAANYLYFVIGSNSNERRLQMTGPWSTGVGYIFDSGSVTVGRLNTSPLTNATRPHIAAFRRDRTDFAAWQGQASLGTATRASAPAVAFSATYTLFTGLSFVLGTLIDGNIEYYKGDLHEVLHFNRALSADERVAVTRYLGAKWGITV